MHIASYRGPGQAGGVSAALARAWDANLGTGGLWWHIDDCRLQVSQGIDTPNTAIATIPKDVISGHYRFCNEFLWPIMHDLPQYAKFVPQDKAYYDSFNEAYGFCMIRSHSEQLPSNFFVQDYQLALLPTFLKENAGFRSIVFWHIPWPKNVAPEYVDQIRQIISGMLGADAVGFHTQEYADNFLAFINEHMTDYATNSESLSIWSESPVARVAAARWIAPQRFRQQRQMYGHHKHVTNLVVAPLGIDFDHWTSLAATQQNTVWHPALMKTPFVLSVDRADYTKAVLDRIEAIDLFLERHPEWAGNIVFAQVCGKTRTGLESFDGYWDQCHQRYSRLKDRWATDTWQPLMWIESSFSSAELAHMYRTASAMMVNAVRDGLNLTAKEYVACQSHAKPGVLALSSGAGAYQELGKHTVSLDPGNISQLADSIQEALTMDAHEKQWRMALLKESVRSNTLNRWWHTFASLLETPAIAQQNYAMGLKESS